MQKRDKKGPEEEHSSEDDSDSNTGGGEPVDAATLEAEVARLRQLVVRPAPVWNPALLFCLVCLNALLYCLRVDKQDASSKITM